MNTFLVSHPTGNANVRAVLETMAESGRLAAFVTSIGLPAGVEPRGPWGKIRAHRRYPVAPAQLHCNPFRDAGRLLAQKLGLEPLLRHETGPFCVDRVYADIARLTEKTLRNLCRTERGPAGVYCYEDGALAPFRAARELGVARIYDLPIAYWERSHQLLREECERLPAWAPTLAGVRDSGEKLRRKTEEAELADTIICPSRFVLESLPQRIRESKTCALAPFGCPTIDPTLERVPEDPERPLRVLFVGSMTQRKGLADLFAAVAKFDRRQLELVILGSPAMPMEFYRKNCPEFRYEPPRSHTGVLEIMNGCDVLALPSYVEGRALVQLEALACGLPILISPNTGGDDLVSEAETGFVVPIRSPDAIAGKLDWFLRNRGQLAEMREACRRRAEAITWEGYRRRISGILDETLAAHG